jgi:hypothetical protein
MLNKTFLFLFIITCFMGCKKYPEDPSTVHFRTAKKRLTQPTFYTQRAKSKITGINYAGSYGNDRIFFNKNGTFKGENAIVFQFNGIWEFEDEKNSLHIYNDTKSFHFKIIRLDAHYLTLENDSIRCEYKSSRP